MEIIRIRLASAKQRHDAVTHTTLANEAEARAEALDGVALAKELERNGLVQGLKRESSESRRLIKLEEDERGDEELGAAAATANSAWEQHEAARHDRPDTTHAERPQASQDARATAAEASQPTPRK